jgi:nicotinamide-nucleotide amidase
VVAYADRAKTELLGVPASLLAEHGAVSEPVVRSMAEGFRARSGVEVALAVTGIAGPTGGTAEKPVGLVWSAIAIPAGTRSWEARFAGTRDMVMTRTTNVILNRLRLVLQGEGAVP